MKVQNSKITKKFLVVVSSAIVYQSIEFSHSLAPGSARMRRQLVSNGYTNATEAPLTRTYVASVTPELKQGLVSIPVTG
jgi:hypothetical protein